MRMGLCPESAFSFAPRHRGTLDGRPLIVRRAIPSDASRVVATVNAVCSERIYLITEQYVPTPEWEQVLHRPGDCPQHLLLVPELEDQVIGWCRVFSDDSGQKTRHVADIGIGVLRPFREIGIGTALMEDAVRWATEQGLEKLTVSTFSTNLRAINLFKKVRFVRTGVRYGQYKIDGAYVDEILMERFL